MKKLNLRKDLIYILIVIILLVLFLFIANWQYLNMPKLPKLVEEIFGSLMGAAVVAMITIFLLKRQTESEEKREKDTKIFEKKIELFEDFLKSVNDLLTGKNGKLQSIEDEDLIAFRFKLSLIAIHTADNELTEVSNCCKVIFDNITEYVSNQKPLDINTISENIFKISSIFHKELYKSDEDKKDYSGNFDFANLIKSFSIITESIKEKQAYQKTNLTNKEFYNDSLLKNKELVEFTEKRTWELISTIAKEKEIVISRKYTKTGISFRLNEGRIKSVLIIWTNAGNPYLQFIKKAYGDGEEYLNTVDDWESSVIKSKLKLSHLWDSYFCIHILDTSYYNEKVNNMIKTNIEFVLGANTKK